MQSSYHILELQVMEEQKVSHTVVWVMQCTPTLEISLCYLKHTLTLQSKESSLQCLSLGNKAMPFYRHVHR